MTDTEIITRLASEIHGWGVIVSTLGNIFAHTPRGDVILNGPLCWNPLESWADVMELQAAIPEQAREVYIVQLRKAIYGEEMGDSLPPIVRHFAFASATPRQRCAAMLAVLDARRKVPVVG